MLSLCRFGFTHVLKAFWGDFCFWLSSRTLLLANWLCHVRVFLENWANEEVHTTLSSSFFFFFFVADSDLCEADVTSRFHGFGSQSFWLASNRGAWRNY